MTNNENWYQQERKTSQKVKVPNYKITFSFFGLQFIILNNVQVSHLTVVELVQVHGFNYQLQKLLSIITMNNCGICITIKYQPKRKSSFLEVPLFHRKILTNNISYYIILVLTNTTFKSLFERQLLPIYITCRVLYLNYY